MKSTLLHRSLATALVIALTAPLTLAQGHGPGGDTGGVGGSYNGPGDTVPNSPTPDAPGPSGPVHNGPGGGGPSGGTGAPPIAGPVLPGAAPPPPGAYGPLPPDEPTTPDSQPPVSDPTSWQLWWHYNRWDHLPAGRAEKLLARSSSEGFFLGRGQSNEPTAARATDGEITQVVRPALLAVLQEGGREELVKYALQALAKLRDHPADDEWNFNTAARRYLRDPNQSIAEGAILALGIRGDSSWTTALFGILGDTKEGRELVGRSKVGHRLRAFSAYAIALVADRVPEEMWRLEVHRKLAAALPDERPEVQAAILIAIGHCAMEWKPASETGSSSVGAVTLADQIRLVATFLEDEHMAVLARSQAAQALSLLARTAPPHLRADAALALQSQIGPHARASTEIKNGAVLALGGVGTAERTPLDDAIRDDLERVVTGPGADRLTRYFALIALGQIASRPGRGEEPLGAQEETRSFLLRQLGRSRGMQMAWTSLALGILEEGSVTRGGMASAETSTALRDALKQSRNGDVAGAVALALGMMRDLEAVPQLIETVETSGSPILRGYAALGLGMIGDRRALQPLRVALQGATNLPGSLQRVAIGLSLLGDAQASPVLANLLVRTSSPEVQASLAAALGWVRDPKPLPLLTERLAEDPNTLSRAWISVAVGRIADADARPWNASLSVGVNYDVALPTLHDPDVHGVLDYP